MQRYYEDMGGLVALHDCWPGTPEKVTHAAPVKEGDMFIPHPSLEEVNERRAKKNIAPFEFDGALTEAAMTIALERAKAHKAGHTSNDFSGLPEGAQAEASGCAAWKPGTGFGSCCSEENWKYAGAARCQSDDGLSYMQLFVSNKPNKSVRPIYYEG